MAKDLWRQSTGTERGWLSRVMAALVIAVALGAGAVRAQTFSDTLQTAFTVRTVGDSPLSFLQVSAPTAVSSISVLNDITTAQNQKFLIFNNTTSTFLLVSGSQPFAADGVGTFTWKQSASFAPITLLPGNDYLVGAISDTAGDWAYNTAGTFTQGTISSFATNGNAANFAVPVTICCAGGRIPLQLNASAAAPVPVAGIPTVGPPALGLIIVALGLFGLMGLRRRARSRR